MLPTPFAVGRLALGAARAQSTVPSPELNAQTFRPSLDGGRTLLTDDATFSRHLRPTARLLFQYVNDPLIYVRDGVQSRIVSDIVQGDLLLGLGYDRLRVGVDLPYYLLTSGVDGDQSGLGDMGAELRLGFLDPERDAFGLALHGRLNLPTASVDTSLGESAVGYEAGVIVDLRLDETQLALNLGTQGRPEHILENVEVGDQLYYRASLAQSLVADDAAGLAAELGGAWNYGEPLSNQSAFPLEGLLTGWTRFGDIVLRAGAGMGLTEGIGAPDARALLSVGYEPPTSADRDRDGILDEDDECRTEPEDVDGYRDQDGCPDPATLVMVRFVDEDGQAIEGVRMAVEGNGLDQELSVRQAHPLHAGSYTLQATADGYVPLSTTLEVPSAAEHEVTKILSRPPGMLEITVVGPDGQPVDARLSLDGGDRGRTEGQAYQVKVSPGAHQVRASANGYRVAEVTVDLESGTREAVVLVMEPSQVVVTTEQVELREKVQFDTNLTTIKPESFPLLEEVARVLKEHPELTRLRIEGHTDERGSDTYNQRLSDGRAESVRAWLVEHGVQADRLRSIGYGESKPLDEGHNEAAWEKNRRVEMWIEERSDK